MTLQRTAERPSLNSSLKCDCGVKATVLPFGKAGPGYCDTCAAKKLNANASTLSAMMKFLDVARKNHGPEQRAQHHCAECEVFARLPVHIRKALDRRMSA